MYFHSQKTFHVKFEALPQQMKANIRFLFTRQEENKQVKHLRNLYSEVTKEAIHTAST